MSSTTISSTNTIKSAYCSSFNYRNIVKRFLELLEKAVVPTSATVETVELIAEFLDVTALDAIKWVKEKNVLGMTIAFYRIMDETKGHKALVLNGSYCSCDKEVSDFMNSPNKPATKYLKPVYKSGSTVYRIDVTLKNDGSATLFEGEMTPLIYEFLNAFLATHADLPYESTLQVVGYAFEDLKLESSFLASILPAPKDISVIDEKTWPAMDLYMENIKGAIGTLASGATGTVVPEVLITIIEEIKKIPGAEVALTAKMQETINFHSMSPCDFVKVVCVANKVGIAVDRPTFMVHAPSLDESKCSEFVKAAYRERMIQLLLEKIPGEDRYICHSLVVKKMLDKYCLLHERSMIDYLETFVGSMKCRIEDAWISERISGVVKTFILRSPMITPKNVEVLKKNLRILLRVFPDLEVLFSRQACLQLEEYLGTSNPFKSLMG